MFLRILIFSLAATLVSQAAGKRKFRTLYYGRPGGPEEMTMTIGDAGVTVPLPSGNLSSPLDLADGSLSVVFSSKPLPPKAPLPVGIPKAEIPEAWSEVLFLFTPDPSNAVAPVRVVALDLGTEKFKPGQLLVFNRSQAFVGGRIGSQVLKLPALKSAFVEAPAAGEADYSVAIDMVLPGEKDQKTLCRSTWRHTPQDRQLVFVLPAPERKSLSIASVPIHPLPEAGQE